MTQKWNLQDIRPVNPKRRTTPPRVVNEAPPAQVDREENYEEEFSTVLVKDGNKEGKKKLIIISSVVVVLILAIIGSSAVLAKTTLTVYPEYNEPNVNAELNAFPDKRTDALTYTVMTLDETGERQVKASGQEQIETQAKGFIEIVKTTPGSERLIKNTRFRSPGGLIYRIQESVVVPGAIKDTSGAVVPGTIRAEVFAEAVGEEYNLEKETRFDIPGFKENNLMDLYGSIHAVNREDFTGGFKGQKFIIDQTELETAEQALRIELRDKLLAKVDGHKLAGFTTFPGSVAFTYATLPTIKSGDNLATLVIQATLQIPQFKSEDFASYIAKETVATYDRSPVRITNTEGLTFTYTDKATESSNIANLPAISFKIVGKPQLVWEFDEVKLQKDLAGKQKTAISGVLAGHPGIKSAKVATKPFWRRSFPEDPKDIEILEVIGEKSE